MEKGQREIRKQLNCYIKEEAGQKMCISFTKLLCCSIVLFFGGTRVWTQGLTLARQALDQLFFVLGITF
jgi:hypothetical protein